MEVLCTFATLRFIFGIKIPWDIWPILPHMSHSTGVACHTLTALSFSVIGNSPGNFQLTSKRIKHV